MNKLVRCAAHRAGLAAAVIMVGGTASIASARTEVKAAAGAAPSVFPLNLKDVDGKEFPSARLQAARASVFLFTSTECPIAGIYTPRMIALAREYSSRGVQFFLIDSNIEDSADALR